MIHDWLEEHSPEEIDADYSAISAANFMCVSNLAEAINFLRPLIQDQSKNISGHTLECIFHFMVQARVMSAQALERTKAPKYRKSEIEINRIHHTLSEED